MPPRKRPVRPVRTSTRRVKMKMQPPFTLAAIDSGKEGAIAILRVRSRTDIDLISVHDMPYANTEPLPHIRTDELTAIIQQADYATVEAVRPIKGKSTLDKAMMQGGGYYPIGDALERCGLLDKTFMTSDNGQDWKVALGVGGSVGGNKKTKTFNLICSLFPDKVDLFTGVQGGMKDGRTDAVAIGLSCVKFCVE